MQGENKHRNFDYSPSFIHNFYVDFYENDLTDDSSNNLDLSFHYFYLFFAL